MPKILAIDDNNDNLISLKAIINDAFPGSIVLTALNGPKGIELATDSYPDVILLDIIMPEMDGFEVCSLLKLEERTRDIPVVFLTALKGDKESRIKALEVGAEGFLSKPIDEVELIAQIRAMVKIKAASEQKRDEKVKLEKLVEERTSELLQSQAQLKSIFENLQDAYFQADLSGKFALVSPSALKMYGYRSIDELLGQPAEQLYFNPKERHSLISILRTEGQIKDYVSQGRKSDGSAFWVSLNIQWLWSKDRQIIGTEGVVRDITERIKAERALKESEEKYRLMVDLLPEAVIIHEGGKLVFANAAALKTAGADSFEQLMERSLLDFVHPDYRTFSLNRIKEIYSTGQPSTFLEEKFITLKDEILDVEVIGTPVVYMGKPAIQTIIRDITERKRAEEAIREREEKFRSIFENVQDVYYESLLDGTILEISPSIKILSKGQACREDILGKSLADFYAYPEERTNVLSSMQKSGSVTDYELSIKNIDGSIIPCTISAKLVFDIQGHPEKIIGSLRDITRRKHDEEKIRKSEAQFREFFEKAADAIFIAEIESGIIVDANVAASRLMLRPHNELVGIHQTELHPQVKKNDTNDSFKKHKELVKQNLSSFVLENTVVRADGIEIPVEILASEVDYHGKRCLLGTFRDISERKRANEALKNSLSLTEATLESIHNGILVDDHEGRMIKTNSRFGEMWRIPEEILSTGDDKTLLNFIHDQLINPDEFVSKVMELYAKPEVESKDLVYFKDGRVFERVSKPMLIEDMPKGRIWSFLDITDRERAENELRENVARLELAMSTANMAWWEMDMTTGYVTFERRKAEMLGYAPEKFKHYTDFTALVHPEDHERTMNAMRLLLKGSLDKYEVEYRIKSISGEYKWFYDIGSVTKRDSEGKPLIVSGLVLNISERKQADEELQKSYNMLEKLADQVPGVVYQYRLYPDGRTAFPFSSPGMYNIYELTPDEVREDASPVLTRIHPDDADYIVEAIAESARNQTIYHSEFRVILPKQGLRWRMSDAKPELLEDGSTLWHGIITDITERKQNEETLLERKQLFKGLFDASPDAILLMDTNHPAISWPIVDCNEAACWMNGYTREEMIGQSIDLLHATKGIPEERDIYYNDLKREGILRREHIHRHKDGHIFPIESSTTIVTVGGHEMILGIDRDITDRKKAEAELLEKNTFIQTILDNLPIGIALNSIDNGIALYMNKKFEEIYGWPSQEIKDVSDFFYNVYPDENYRNELISTIMTDIQSGDTQRMHWENIFVTRKDGSKRVINAVNIPLVDQNTMVSTVSDITELHKSQIDLVAAKEKAEESDRLKSAFLANMSHEIRTPLNSIIGFSDLLFDPEFDEEQRKSFAENISLSGNGLLAIISDIMDLSKIETGQVHVNKSKFSIHRVISDIHRAYVFQASKKGIELRIDPLNPEDIFIESDEDKLRQVLINFVTNALKFTESGFIEMGIRDQGNSIYVQVKDTGIGIPEEYHGNVFERFRQVESAKSRKYGGNGLGLAISKSLVEMLGGKIGIESVEGCGSTFYFTIPK